MSEEILKKVAENIKHWRKKLKIKQGDMANFGFTTRHYQQLESGKSNMTILTLQKIATAFGIDIGNFFGYQKKEVINDNDLFLKYVQNDNPFIGIGIWRLKNMDDPESLELVAFNQTAEQIINFSLKNRIGHKMVDIFDNVKSQEQHLIYYEVITTGKPIKLRELLYSDENIPTAIYDIWLHRLPNKYLCLMFEDITTEKLRQDIRTKIA